MTILVVLAKLPKQKHLHASGLAARFFGPIGCVSQRETNGRQPPTITEYGRVVLVEKTIKTERFPWIQHVLGK